MERENLEAFCTRLTDTLGVAEKALRRFHPALVARICEQLGSYRASLEGAREELPLSSRAGDGGAWSAALESADLTLDGLRRFCEAEDYMQAVNNFMLAAWKFCRAQEILFCLRHEVVPVHEYFLEGSVRGQRIASTGYVETSGGTGLMHVGAEDDSYARGAFSIYVPELHDLQEPRPLVVALHGGFGHGRDFIWMWLREARSRGFLLLAPSSLGRTWDLGRVETDRAMLKKAVAHVSDRWPVDPARILLTGISDGGTYALSLGLEEDRFCSALAPVAAVLAPVDLSCARARRILWIHGAHDWMFPPERARQGCEALIKAGANATLEIIPDLAHTYPREQNDRILTWFDPTLALPGRLG